MPIIHCPLLSSLLITLTLIFPTLGALQQGFTTDLIHRDSPLSPLYNPSLDKWERVRKSIHRSISRINRNSLSSSVSPNEVIVSQVRPTDGEYVMEVSLGTPPMTQFGIVDTGSDLIWTQCEPCRSCYDQKLPIFNPNMSSTYKIQPCESEACKYLLPSQESCTKKDTCSYTYSYGDQSSSSGDLATETLTINSQNRGDTASFPKVTFGCGQSNRGIFDEDSSGVIGLGDGPLSLVSQLSSSIGGKFSYCLTPFSEGTNVTSKINFGTKGEVLGPGVVSTPLVKKSPKTFYYLTLEGISVGKTRIPFSSFKHSPLSSSEDYGITEGNIIIDSGTTLTLLPPDMHSDLFGALFRVIRGKRVDDPTRTLNLCYQASEALKIPNITAHFTGADLLFTNTFINVSDDVVCFAMVSSIASQNLAIFGNIALANYLVGYDLEEGRVSFKPADCSNEQ